jgi:hypothetical protein
LHAQADAAAAPPGGLVLCAPFPGANALPDAQDVTLADSGLLPREKLVVKAGSAWGAAQW